MNPSSNLFLIGPTGAGKSTIGASLARHYGLVFIDLDQEIERSFGKPACQVLNSEGEASFRHRESALLEEYSGQCSLLIATGGGAVLDMDNRRYLAERGYVIWLQVTLEQQWQRLRHDTQRPLLAGHDRYARLQAMAELREALYRATADLAIPACYDDVLTNTRYSIALIDACWQQHHAR